MATMGSPSNVAADFREYLRRNEVLAIDPSSSQTRRVFVPIQALRHYLNRSAIQKLLLYFHRSAAEWRCIHSDYLAVFAVLVTISKGAYITHFIRYNHLTDDRLPFLSAADLPQDCTDFFAQFAAAQWRFCPLRLQEDRLVDKRFAEELIIPFTSCKAIKQGTDSSTYIVVVHPDCNLLANEDRNTASKTNTFILKTCRAEHVQYHESEVGAYKTIRNQYGDLPNMARFYGSWSQAGRYNMLLEYVDGGNLEDYFETHAPPTKKEDILKFWRNMLDLIKPVMRIHRCQSPHDSHQYLQGIHHDIKASNILVSYIGPSEYDVIFKLADLGLADFELTGQEGRESRRLDVSGAQTFSAPECFRDETDPESKHKILDARPSKDIWSLGCVYSEALVWSVLGKDGLDKYQNDRKAATDELPDLRDTSYEICFHDGTKVLEAVLNMHVRVRQEHRLHDYVVAEVIPITEDMLLPVEDRLDANAVYERSKRALARAVHCSMHDSDGPPESSYPTIFQTERRQPPQIPPEILATRQRSHPYHSNAMDKRDPSISPSCSGSDLDEEAFPMPGAEPGFGYFADYNRKSAQNGRADHSKHEKPSRRVHPSGPKTQPSPTKDENTHAEDVPPKANKTTARHSAPRIKRSGKHEAEDFKNNIVASKPSESHSERAGSRERLPVATVHEVAEWIKKKKKNSSISPLPGREYLNRLDGRDQIFLIDNSGSMKNHWEDVVLTFSTMAYLVKPMDPDGIEIRFTNAPRSHCARSKDRRRLLALLKSKVATGQSDITLSLGRILRECASKPRKEKGRLSSLWRKDKWGVNIYVLTDGIWEEGDGWLDGVVEPVKDLLKNGMELNQMGIEFIQFGNDKEGTKRLKILDDDLHDYGVSRDIMDTEPWTGNVYKMLLGSIDRAWDQHRPESPDTPPGLGAEKHLERIGTANPESPRNPRLTFFDTNAT